MNPNNRRGVTLVELMVVVVIIGILAALASIGYSRYVRTAKIQKLKQYAMELASGQERYKSRNNFYWAGGSYVGNEDKYTNLMDFAHTIPPQIILDTEGWDGAGGSVCTICTGAPVDLTNTGFGVRVQQDLVVGGPLTTVLVTNSMPNPLIINEGE